MPRRGGIKPRKIEPDPVYKNRVISKLINRCIRDGKKTKAQKQVYKALEIIKDKTDDDPIKVFTKALDNIKPEMEVRPRRIGGAAYQIPMPVTGSRKEALAIRWLITAARARNNSQYKTFADKLSSEILDATNMEGGAIKKMSDTQRMAEANKAFAHFRW